IWHFSKNFVLQIHSGICAGVVFHKIPFRHYIGIWRNYLGDPNSPDYPQKMKEKSPTNYVEQVKKPMLIIHGEKDVRVRKDQSERFVTELKKRGKEVEFVLLAREGHLITHWKSNLKVYRKTEDFLAKCLGGRSSGFDFYQLGTLFF
ncbi:prolyl oligopeptidase family serine peptidase, partial [bacterium]|nr:prolyl oligopeptidase family serine peptidase [bacterium]